MAPPTIEPRKIITAVAEDLRLTENVAELIPHPLGDHRLFRLQWRPDDSRCVLKVDLGELEAIWMPAMAERSQDIVPGIRANGSRLGNLDLNWIVMDELPYRARSDSAPIARDVMHTAARFHQVAAELDLPSYPIDAGFVSEYGMLAIEHDCPGPATAVVARAQLDADWLESLGGQVLGHGDVHFWNAVSADPAGPWRLIDPIPRTAHWAWDAAYAQMTSGVPETPDLIGLLRDERRRLRLPVPGEDQLDRIRIILLGWSSLMWWTLLRQRRHDSWWSAEVRRHVTALADLDHAY